MINLFIFTIILLDISIQNINLFVNDCLCDQIFQSPPRWVGMQSIAQAKSKIGHAVMMILQVGLLDKFKDIPLVTGLDLACFAAAVLTSSACIFVLSKLHH